MDSALNPLKGCLTLCSNTMSTGGQTCTWDWPPWASTCPSPTCREPSVLPWLLGSRAPPLAIQALICLWSRRSSWCTLGIPVYPMKEDVERARMTFPSLMTDNMSLVFSATRPCWPSSARTECSSVPSKTSKWCSKRGFSLLMNKKKKHRPFPKTYGMFHLFTIKAQVSLSSASGLL